MFTIRHAVASDIPLIRELCYQVWPQTYASILTPAQIDYMLAWMYSVESLQQQLQQGIDYLLCYDDVKPVGFAALADHGAGDFKLEKIYVLPNQQGKGTGRYLLGQIIAQITSKGATSLTLQVNKHNTAKSFYEKFGFEVIQEAVFDIGNGFVMDDYVMELKLSRQNSLR
ncbi:MAG TPA: GNAT family N-acetyltransferase [Candidatus Acidoferrum sp.]|nr:GNAT family N-acetyltransferase [Candidatus Acidoferrum sp.]